MYYISERKEFEDILYNRVEHYKFDINKFNTDAVQEQDDLADAIHDARAAGAEDDEILVAIRRLKVRTPHIDYSQIADTLDSMNEERESVFSHDPIIEEDFMERLRAILCEPANKEKKSPSLADKAFLQASVMGIYKVETKKAPITTGLKATAARKSIDLMASFNDTTPEDLLGFDPDEYILPHGYEW